MKYKATYLGESVIVEHDQLKLENVGSFIDKLNDSGLGLGSGHDGIELRKDVLILTPYVGRMDQHVHIQEVD